jgi:hypothetical protein
MVHQAHVPQGGRVICDQGAYRKWVLTRAVHLSQMALTAEQHAQLATAYEKAAADWLVPPQQQAVFARKARWFRLLETLAGKKEKAANIKRAAGR